MECGNDEAIRAWLDGGCDETTALALEAHVDRCPVCEAVVAALVKHEVPAGNRSGAAPVLHRGASLGRYRIVEVLGAGAMGVVYAARDEALDRTVAVKLLGSGLGTFGDAATRLEREAQAMARLSHPNVVAVYEIGTYGDAPFVVMEHVDGVTLSEWLREHGPDRDEILRLFREAAIGLQAVHRAGLVHRDFKPANVLVARDGRVRIADFGLVHLVAGGSPPRLDGTERAGDCVTMSGAVIGTPAYLAPEQLDGQADARSDQFSFCVALFEACFGQRPFQGATLQELGAAVRAGALRLPKILPPGTRWLVPILRRGLAHDPAERFSDLGALIAALSRSPAHRRRLTLTAAGSLVGMAALVFGVRSARGPDCGTVERGLIGIWDAARREAVRAAFLSRQGPRAVQAWEKVSTALDAYAADWVNRRWDACVRSSNDEAARGLIVARMACLDRRLAELRALSDLLASHDVDIAEHGPQAVLELRSLDSCDREVAAVADLSTNEQAVLARLTEVRMLSIVGRQKDALELARTTLPASEHARPAIRAKALLRSGQLELRRSLDVGVAQLRQAALIAETAREDETRAEALIHLTFAMSQLTAPPDLALGEQYADEATAVLARLGGDRHLDPLALLSRGLLLKTSERFEDAVAHLERALSLLDRDPTRESREYNRLVTALGRTLVEMGRPEEGLVHLERVLASTEATVGPQSPNLATAVLNVGEALLRSGRAREAIPYLERAGKLFELEDGAGSRTAAGVPLTLGMCRAAQGDVVAARTLFEQSLEAIKGLASDDIVRFEVELELGQLLAKTGDPGGQVLLEHALQGAHGIESTAKVRFALAQALPRAERKRARSLAEEARATYLHAGARRAKEVAAIDAWLAKE